MTFRSRSTAVATAVAAGLPAAVTAAPPAQAAPTDGSGPWPSDTGSVHLTSTRNAGTFFTAT
ncbi:hypothetical protein [Nonomuraea jabiensis]|uniref:hypothetical protein n=1 Tax=Nonomuraea jabiensis TaxID=882448 RepID=UPI0036C542F9